jgi:hypothetical protein
MNASKGTEKMSEARLRGFYTGYFYKAAAWQWLLEKAPAVLGAAGGKTKGVVSTVVDRVLSMAQAATGKTVDFGKEIAVNWVIPIALVAPAVAGVAAGITASKLMRPSKLDEESIQQELESATGERVLAELQRKRFQDLREEESESERTEPGSSERTLRL